MTLWRIVGVCLAGSCLAGVVGLVGSSTSSAAPAAPAGGGAAAVVAGPSEGAAPDAVAYTPPANNRLKFNFNQDWKYLFTKQDLKGAEAPGFDDGSWADVSLPHTCNDVDSFRLFQDNGRSRQNIGKMWYRKHFTLDAAWAEGGGRKVFFEFEGVRNTGIFYVNGQLVGQHDDQIGPAGLDVTKFVKFGGDNVIAVFVDNDMQRKSPRGVNYGWSTPVFYPNFGGLHTDVVLHLTDKLYSTLPLYSNLKTSGTYVYEKNIDSVAKSADITIEAEVANDYDTPQTATYEASIIDRDGAVKFSNAHGTKVIPAGEKTKFTFTIPLTQLHLWSPDFPYLYTMAGSLKINGKRVDVYPVTFGIRQATFSAKDGLLLNGNPIYLKGYAPRTTMEWAVTGIPQDWMLEYDYKLMKENNANFIRPMHVALRKFQVESADKFGIILACPAGNHEGDDLGEGDPAKRWLDRCDVMRDVTIYFRNDPSILFWEASNSSITLQHMQDMHKVKDEWDPNGGRFAGTRGWDEASASAREYQSPMDVPANFAVMPSWDAEYARAEAPRRVWDKYTPTLDQKGEFVLGGYSAIAPKSNKIVEYSVDDFRLNSSEDLALNNVRKFWDRCKRSALIETEAERAKNGVMVGGAKIIYADSNSHGRMEGVECARVSGCLDAVRLPKESYNALTVAHSDTPAIYILGHWNYPAGTVKPVWVIANTDKVHLITYDEKGTVLKDYGATTWEGAEIKGNNEKNNRYAFKFPEVAFAPGKIEAIGLNGATEAVRTAKTTAGPAVALKLTPVIGPGQFRADGSDIAMIDVEVVDAKGQRVPTDEARVDFTYNTNGPDNRKSPPPTAAFLGGYNSGVQNSIGKNDLFTECGINRVFIRATRTPGDFILTATREGLKPATITITSVPFVDDKGLSTQYPRRYGYILGPEPAPPAPR